MKCFHYVMSKGLELSDATTAAVNFVNLAASGGSVELLGLVHDKDAKPGQKALSWNALHWALTSQPANMDEYIFDSFFGRFFDIVVRMSLRLMVTADVCVGMVP